MPVFLFTILSRKLLIKVTPEISLISVISKSAASSNFKLKIQTSYLEHFVIIFI
jgi:hypothetical protein